MKKLKYVFLGLALCVMSSPVFARSHVDFSFNFGFLPLLMGPPVHEHIIVAPPAPPCCCEREVIVHQYRHPYAPYCPYCPRAHDEVIIHRHSHCCPCY